MIDITIIYFSGTGNTRYIAERIFRGLHLDIKRLISIEDDIRFDEIIGDSRDIMLLYPIIGGNMPRIMRDFLDAHREAFCGKGLYTVVSEAGFSGDGGALAYRYLGSADMTYLGSEHIISPTNISMGRLFRVKNVSDKRIMRLDRSIDRLIRRINEGRAPKTGSSRLAYILGYHLQRKYFMRIEDSLRKKFSVDNSKCIHCGRCISLCPTHNITERGGHVIGNDRCTLCYRCVHSCPSNAIEILHREPIQYRGIYNAKK